MQLVCLGVGDAFSTRWYSSCLAVRHEGFTLLVDCPHPIRKIMAESGAKAGQQIDVGDVDALLLTHLHADHASGLEGFAFYSRILLGRRPPLAAHPDVLDELWDPHLAITLGRATDASRPLVLEDYFEVIPLSEDRETTVGPFEVLCRRTLHPIPTFAMRLRAGGRTLGHSSDTSFDPSLIAWLEDADLIVHETNYGIHTPYEALLGLPEAIRSRMRLTHYPDDFDLAASAIEPLVPGGVYEV